MKPPPLTREKRLASILVGAKELGEIYERSRWWGQRLLRQWYREQLAGGEVRVIARSDGNRTILETTRGAIWRNLPPGRDRRLVMQVERLEAEIEAMSRRLTRLEAELRGRR